MAATPIYAPRTGRAPRSLPFGWEAVTVLLVGVALEIAGIALILVGFFNFLSGTIGTFTSDSWSLTTFFQSFFGAIMLFVIGGILAGVGGWLLWLWWIFLLVGAVAGTRGAGDTVRDREALRPDVRVRCRTCGRLNPEFLTSCVSCGQPV